MKVMCKVLFQNPHVPMYSPRIQLWIISRNTEPRGEDARQQWQLGPFDIFLKKMADNLIRKVCKRSGMCGRKKGGKRQKDETREVACYLRDAEQIVAFRAFVVMHNNHCLILVEKIPPWA